MERIQALLTAGDFACLRRDDTGGIYTRDREWLDVSVDAGGDLSWGLYDRACGKVLGLGHGAAELARLVGLRTKG